MVSRSVRWWLLVLALVCTLMSDKIQMRSVDSDAIIMMRKDFARIEASWTPYMQVRGIDVRGVTPYFITPANGEQPCGRSDLQFTTRNATACSDNRRYYVIVPVRYAAQLYAGEYGKGRLRKVPARALLAHEYGHIVQFMLSQRFDLQLPEAAQQEQLSDCLAGVMIHELYGFKWTLPGNDAVGRWYADIGDPKGVHSHGSALERHNAFDFGYGSGMVGVTNCFQKFWPKVTGL